MYYAWCPGWCTELSVPDGAAPPTPAVVVLEAQERWGLCQPGPLVIARSRASTKHTLDRKHSETWTFVLLSIWEWGAVCFPDITSRLTLIPIPLLWRDWKDWFILQECQPAALWMGKMYLLLCIQANSLFLSTAYESSSLLPPVFLGAKFISDLFSLLNL